MILEFSQIFVKTFFHSLNLYLYSFSGSSFSIIFTTIILKTFLIGCLSPLQLVVFLGFYLIPSFGDSPLPFHFDKLSVTVIFVLEAAGLWFFLLLSVLWWLKLSKRLTQLLDGRDWWWVELAVALVEPVVKNPPANAGDMRHGFDPWVRKIPWRRA